MKIGIYGGTFDPPHIGHVHACKCFLEQIEMDKLFIIPTSIPPHKNRDSKVSGSDRMEMAKLAFSELSSKIVFSDVELNRTGKSYTSDTIKHFLSSEIEEIFLLCGTDMFVTLDEWHEFVYIFQNATIVCVRRENDSNFDDLILDKAKIYREKYGAKIHFIKAEAIDMSSSMIRREIDDTSVATKNLPTAVYEFIKSRGLYNEQY
jgi:nicotinate-nucleotide adenylyltransferase